MTRGGKPEPLLCASSPHCASGSTRDSAPRGGESGPSLSFGLPSDPMFDARHRRRSPRCLAVHPSSGIGIGLAALLGPGLGHRHPNPQPVRPNGLNSRSAASGTATMKTQIANAHSAPVSTETSVSRKATTLAAAIKPMRLHRAAVCAPSTSRLQCLSGVGSEKVSIEASSTSSSMSVGLRAKMDCASSRSLRSPLVGETGPRSEPLSFTSESLSVALPSALC
mmetsp:Transcript_977/g.2549  ORF Transcript_977/g.2549 Transcript_977/m.2549 type:complete len:223 (+) Transcript_977:1066-1734(+)